MHLFARLFLNFVHLLVNLDLVLYQQGSQDLRVDLFSALSSGVEHPHEEDKLISHIYFEELEHGDEAKNDRQYAVEKGQKAVHSPVSEPVLVIITISTFQSLKAHVCGVQEPHNTSDQRSSQLQNHQ